ncbi:MULTISPECIES: hypothetical protein [Ramlibacter]|uniref:hypothetical protein n=1 Tax=Ramlibacter TaxID=174951 RepID=UPI0018DF4654|nr:MULTISPECIES: hypothetical protein [Ramlibacter]
MKLADCLPGSRLALAAALALQACVFVPRTAEVYDADCQIAARRMQLEAIQIASISGCNNEGCALLLAAAGATAAASAVVSGSIVVAGNAVYWLEKQGRCVRARPAATGAVGAAG